MKAKEFNRDNFEDVLLNVNEMFNLRGGDGEGTGEGDETLPDPDPII